MEILSVWVKGKRKKPHVWDLPTPANMYTVYPTLRTYGWQRQNNELWNPKLLKW